VRAAWRRSACSGISDSPPVLDRIEAGRDRCLQAEATGACALFLVVLVSVMAVMALLTMMARLAMMTMRPFGFGALVGHGR